MSNVKSRSRSKSGSKSFSKTSGVKKVSSSFSRFDRCMLRRAIDTFIEEVTEDPKSYMEYFDISSESTVNRTIRSLNRSKVKLGL